MIETSTDGTQQHRDDKTNSYLRPRWNFTSVEGKKLCIEGKPIEELVREHGTPFYLIVESEVRARLRRFQDAFQYTPFQPQYAVKCNSNPAILRAVREECFEADASSIGEVMLALKSGFRPEQIMLTNQYKSAEELHLAISLGIKALGIDSLEDMQDASRMAELLDKEANIFLRINAKIKHGDSYDTAKHQYGIPIDQAEDAIKLATAEEKLKLVGLHWHGAYVPSPEVYFEAMRRIVPLADLAKRMGNPIGYLDFGGGFPAEYGDEDVFTPEDVGKEFSSRLEKMLADTSLDNPTLIFEPGKFIVANSGLAVMKVVSSKNLGEQKILITDGGTYNMLPDPLIWDCRYGVLPATRMDEPPEVKYDSIKGSTCDYLDSIAKNLMLPQLKRGDVLVVTDCGAYSNVIASNFNARKTPPIIMLRQDGRAEVVKRQQSYDEMFAQELNTGRHDDDRLAAEILHEHIGRKKAGRRPKYAAEKRPSVLSS
jgi:diaminopimelate decarboxylase